MKLIHCADLHLDACMESGLSREKAAQRRLEILRTFTRMVEKKKEKEKIIYRKHRGKKSTVKTETRFNNYGRKLYNQYRIESRGGGFMSCLSLEEQLKQAGITKSQFTNEVMDYTMKLYNDQTGIEHDYQEISPEDKTA